MKPTAALGVKIEAAFGDDPFDTTPTFVDISDDVDTWTISRGRPSPLQPFSAGSLSFKLHDVTGDYDPGNTSGAYNGDLIENLHTKISCTPDATSIDLAHGWVDTWDPVSLDPDIEQAEVAATDLWKLVERFSGVGPATNGDWAAGLTSERIVDVLNRAGVPSAWQDIDAGQHLMRARTNEELGVPLDGAAELKLAAESEAPWASVFATRDGKIRFDARPAIASKTGITTSQATLSKHAADIATATNPKVLRRGWYSGLTLPRAETTLADGTLLEAEDATARTQYGPQTFSPDYGQLDETLGGAQSSLDAAIVMYGSRRFGPKLVGPMMPMSTGSEIEDLLTLELGDRVTVKHLTPNGLTINEEAHVQSITITGNQAGAVQVTLAVAAAEFIDSLSPDQWLIWDSGLWDQDKWGY